MKTYFVSVDVHDGSDLDHVGIYAALVLCCPNVSRAMSDMFIATYEGTAEALRDELRQRLGPKDRLMVIGPKSWASCNILRDALPMLLEK